MNDKQNPPPYEEKQFRFLNEMVRRFKKWTNLENDDIVEALRDLTGDTYLEMRKLTNVVLSEIETSIACGRYRGYKDGREFTEQERASARSILDEDLKRALREDIERSWKSILDKQRIGAEKLAIAIKPHLKQEPYDETSEVHQDSVRSKSDE